MKYITYVLLVIALILIVWNATFLDFSNLFQGDSIMALISIVAILCGVCILFIFNVAKSINEKNK
ncbi:hypothetical protein AB4865_02120 [Capnocytophaga sp. ARDL2]|uniref:hypothetical protein n=1 Tax=Capnocytophaga sp. ARDL2 TaxID=3238809 RepID=UPI003556B15B